MYEVELKVELTPEERAAAVSELVRRGFAAEGTGAQRDSYIEAKPSPAGGFDVKRYREEDGKIIYTQKIWEKHGDEWARKEIEREATADELAQALQRQPAIITIEKNREWFTGTYQGAELCVTIDTVKFDHSPGPRYFIEAEIGVSDKARVAPTKALIKSFLQDILGKSDLVLAIGMFKMAYEKL